MRKLLLCLGLSLFLASGLSLYAQVPSPEQFLGYPLGSRFSWHHQVVDYFAAVAEASPQVRLQAYGETYEGRPLMVAFLSSEKNLDQLEQIRQNNLIGAGFASGPAEGPRLPIVWLSYNIHGNESVSTEAAMATLHQLATNDTANWLENMIVVLDPCINPDGRDRYVNWYKQVRHQPHQVEPQSHEHREPWPGGRYNHYLFDLNRDWAWQTQQESRQRAQLYQRWLPQVHVDFHEMGAESPYFFAPAAHPLHQVITDWQKEFQDKVGRNHARYFDQNDWLYFTKEVFDLFYPSYGDTWPTYQGAIGFTYEQGGSGRAGLGYLRETGDTLTLADRLAHHYTTSLSTIETAHRHRERLLEEFDEYFATAKQGDQAYQSYVVRGSTPLGKLEALAELLDHHQIRYQQLSEGRSLSAYDYATGEKRSVALQKGDWVIPAAQPQGNLVRVLFEPRPFLEDSLTYDLTAWAIPYAYQLEAYAVESALAGEEVSLSPPVNEIPEEQPYAYLVKWEDMRSARWLAAILQKGAKVRATESAFRFNNTDFAPGTLVISQADNPRVDLNELVLRLADEQHLKAYPVRSGFAQSGVDLGSGSVAFLGQPKVALVRGDGVSPSRFGEVWHYFEQNLGYPLHTLDTDYLGRANLEEYDVLILPSGSYGRYSGNIYEFASNGGRVIALDRAVRLFAQSASGQSSTTLSASVMNAEDRSEDDPAADADEWLKPYGQRSQEYATRSLPGAVFKVQLDATHPLAYGLGDTYYALKYSTGAYPYLQGAWNVGTYPTGKPLSGFTGYRAQEEIRQTLAIGQESYGRGDLVYLVDSPVFRGFWRGGHLLLANAIFFR